MRNKEEEKSRKIRVPNFVTIEFKWKEIKIWLTKIRAKILSKISFQWKILRRWIIQWVSIKFSRDIKTQEKEKEKEKKHESSKRET